MKIAGIRELRAKTAVLFGSGEPVARHQTRKGVWSLCSVGRSGPTPG